MHSESLGFFPRDISSGIELATAAIISDYLRTVTNDRRLQLPESEGFG